MWEYCDICLEYQDDYYEDEYGNLICRCENCIHNDDFWNEFWNSDEQEEK